MTRSVPVFLFDAFAARPFGGNPAGVVLLDRPAPAAWMQAVARELGASTTGFADTSSAHDGVAAVRFFTPAQEIGACGHATVAIATALAELGVWPPGSASVECAGGRFSLRIRKVGEGGFEIETRQALKELSAPTGDVGLDALLGATELRADLPPMIAATGLRHLLVAVREPASLTRLEVDAAAIAEVSRRLGVDTIGVFCALPDDLGLRVRMRDLCAGIGAVEEPASGTTTGALALALVDRGLLTPSRSRMEVAMGVEMGRPSRLEAEVDLLEGGRAEVRVRGTATRVLSGSLEIAPALPA